MPDFISMARQKQGMFPSVYSQRMMAYHFLQNVFFLLHTKKKKTGHFLTLCGDCVYL